MGIRRLAACLLVLTILFIPTRAMAASINGDEVVFGNNYLLAQGQTLHGNLIVFGGTATVEAGARVTGDILIFGGTTSIDGTAAGDLVIFGGILSVDDDAAIGGDLSFVGGTYFVDPAAPIAGEIRHDYGQTDAATAEKTFVEQLIGKGFDFVGSLFRVFVYTSLAVLLVIFWPKQVERVSQAIIAQPVTSGVVGVLALGVTIPVLGLLAITIVLLCLALPGMAVLFVAGVLGWAAIGFEVGQRMQDALNQAWAPAVSVGIGTLTISLISLGLEQIPCIGWLLPFLLVLVGLGSVVLTRAGTVNYPIHLEGDLN
jgi:hypothetical protein